MPDNRDANRPAHRDRTWYEKIQGGGTSPPEREPTRRQLEEELKREGGASDDAK